MDRHWQNSECENNLSSGNSQKGEEKLISSEPKKSKKLFSTREEELKNYMKQGFVDISDSKPGTF